MTKDRQLSFAYDVEVLYKDEDPLAKCPSITFQVTDDCCLKCSYCYQINKGHRMMTRETSKKAIDMLFKMYDDNDENALINHHTKGIIVDFIGGEPFMNIDTINYASEYLINECIRRDHEWLTNCRFSISSNGLLYFDKAVQEYLHKFDPFISLTITIDGPKELHDACRKDFNGEGSFDRAIKAFRAYQSEFITPINTKVTIAPENLPYLNKIFDFFINEGVTSIHANPIYEHVWTVEEAQLYYKQLKELADKLLENENVSSSLFNTYCGIPLPSKNNSNWCGGTGAMLAFDPDGNITPCIRYMESSLGNAQPPLIIGNVDTGIYQTEEAKKIHDDLKSVTRRSQSTDECWGCHIAGGCAWCSAWNYQVYGTVNKRFTGLCWMHRARSLANSYFYNKHYRALGMERRLPVYLSRDIATQIIDDEEYDMLLDLVSYI